VLQKRESESQTEIQLHVEKSPSFFDQEGYARLSIEVIYFSKYSAHVAGEMIELCGLGFSMSSRSPVIKIAFGSDAKSAHR